MKICVYAICKNESKFVEKWLDSMQEADYIVVMDTGSTDDTFKLLKEDTRVTKIERKIIKPWRFDVARNESMKLIPDDADVLVCTDLDEVFEPGWAQVIRDNWIIGKTNRMFYTYAWSHNSAGEPTDVFVYDKIHDRNYQWIFPVHEVLNRIDPNFEGNVVSVGKKIFLHHYPDTTKPRAYYLDLLKLSMEENPEDSHVRMLYARELFVKGDIDESLEEFLNVLRMPDIDNDNKFEVLLNSLLQVAMIYEMKKHYDEAIWYCQEFIKEEHTFREPYLLMAEIYNEMKMYTLAEACVNAAKEYSYQHFSWVERASTFNGWMDDVESVCKYNLGKIKEAVECGENALKHNPDNDRLIRNLNIYYRNYIAKLKEEISQPKKKKIKKN